MARATTKKKSKTKTRRREVAAKFLENWARRLREGKAIRVGKRTVSVPKRVSIETELETKGAEVELELELKWSIPKAAKRKPSKK